MPLLLVAIILGLYGINPTEKNPIHHAIFLSYPLGPDTPGGPIMYGKGPRDIAFVAFYMIVLSFTREFLMQRLIRPLALRNGIRSRAKIARFMEQAYTAMYFAIFGPFGLYVMSRSPLWYFKTTPMFENFPHREHEAIFKAYYLLQASYWAQQAIVLLLQLEKPRKDFKELVGHHVITLALIALSYRFHFTYMGLAVYITHDISDFFLAVSFLRIADLSTSESLTQNSFQTSKTLNYLDSSIVGPYFALFTAAWIYLRHYLNLRILWACLTEFRTVGPYELNWETQQYKCWISQIITFSLLASLQAVNLFWLFLILRIAKNYVFSHTVADERSDEEEEDDDDDDDIDVDGDDGKKALLKEKESTTSTTTTPVVLLNGKAVDSTTGTDVNGGGRVLRERKR